MSLTKRELDKQNEAESAYNCPNCKWNMDDKFIEEYCAMHDPRNSPAEWNRANAEAEYWEAIDNHYAQTMN